MCVIVYSRNFPRQQKQRNMKCCSGLKTRPLVYIGFIAIICSLMIPLIVHCQESLVNNYGVLLHFNQGSYMIVQNDSLYNHAGHIQNSGTVRIEGDIYNDDTIAGGVIGGLYDIGGNWKNNSVVISRNDTVMLSGDNQFITGTSPTRFHTLVLAGTPGSVKAQTINASVTGTLDLRSSELATNTHEMLVVNTSPNAITKNSGSSGYVSSLDDGRLTRRTVGVNRYFFPVGTPSSLVNAGESFYYRPIVMSQSNGSLNENEYSVRLVNNPTADGYDVTQTDDSIEVVNPLYYHRLYHGLGSDPATITMHFEPSDEAWTDIAHHDGSQWGYTRVPSVGTGAGLGIGFSTITISDWLNFNPFPFAFATRMRSIDTSAIPEAGAIFIPNVFSPNGDGSNETFHPLGNRLEKIFFQVFNRWGEKVFETSELNSGWDGVYQSKLQDAGVYVWRVRYLVTGKTQFSSLTGSVTLVR